MPNPIESYDPYRDSLVNNKEFPMCRHDTWDFCDTMINSNCPLTFIYITDFQQIGSGAPSISANLMFGHSQEWMEGNNTPCNSLPLKYIDPENYPNNSDHKDGLPGGGPGDPNDPEDPNSPDSGPNNEPDDDPDPNCLFLHALHDLSDSLQNLCQPQAAKTEKNQSL